MRLLLLAIAAVLALSASVRAQFTWTSQLRELTVESLVEGDDDDSDYADNFADALNFAAFNRVINATATTQFSGDLIIFARQNSTLGTDEMHARVSVESEVRITPGTQVYGVSTSECLATFQLTSGGRRLVISGTSGLGEGASGSNATVSLRLQGPSSTLYSVSITNHSSQALSFDQVLPDGLYTIHAIAELEQNVGDGDITGFVDVTMRLEGGCAADFNASGAISVQDIFDFLAAYFSNAPNADFNGSGAISVQDIFDFLAAYFTGC